MATFQEMLENSGYKTRDYSGRGMYGKKCLAVAIERGEGSPSPFGIFSDVLRDLDSSDPAAYESDVEVVAKALEGTCADSLSLGAVVYWPGIKFVDETRIGSDEEHGGGLEERSVAKAGV